MADKLSTDDLAATSARGDAARDDETAQDAPLAREGRDDDARPSSEGAAHEPLLGGSETSSFTERWREIQVSFVDEPRESVGQADALVADLMQRLASSFAEERGRLEQHWEGGDDVSTEDLRVALTRYRSFFDRLLSA
jgi:hypothetical protein